ncbi:MAG TPA: polysaccharide biosynthesis/export family protein [Bryobacteraceae bacterium]|jgi:polysaccharide export outer membrane protein|nr:polysaccharide biosynthesis/export family protein [Bryobacteraceae bacterium]
MVFILLLLAAVCLHAQTPSAPNQSDALLALPAQKVGPNDLLSVSVYNTPELTRTVRVSPDGAIRLPMVKKPIPVAGLLPAEIEARVVEVLVQEQLVNEPFVTVNVAQYQSRPISVAGAVKMPVTFQATGPISLLEAITRAGGLAPNAGTEILLNRTSDEAGLVQRIPVKQLLEGSDSAYNLPLHGGEEIRVPEAGKIFVVGNVKKPGSYPMQGDGELTVLKALAMAEGLMPFAARRAYLYRREVNGSKNEKEIELKKILQREAPDQVLQAEDVLYVPDNSGKRLGIAALEKVLMFGTTAGATALVVR